MDINDDILYNVLHWLYQSGDTITATMLLSTHHCADLRLRAKYLAQPAVFTINVHNCSVSLNTKSIDYSVTIDWGVIIFTKR